MASKPSIIPLLLQEDELMCPICRALIRNPVTTPCGHSFCMPCIQQHWARSSLPWFCPHCRRSFICKPVLQPSTVLCSIMENVAKVWAEPEPCTEPAPGITCDVCEDGRQLPADKTCVTCLASFCRVHLMPHTGSRALKKHCLCAPVSNLKELQCEKHGRALELFCRGHRVPVCWQCMPKHRRCSVRAVEEIRREWKASIDPVANEAKDRADATDRALESLDTLSEGVVASAEKMKEDVELCFEALRETIGRVQDKVLTFIDAERTCVLQRIQEHQKILNSHLLAVSETVNQLNKCRTNDSYFNFSQPLPLVPPEISPLQEADVQMDGRAVERIILDLQQIQNHLELNHLESQLCSNLKKHATNTLQDKDSCGVSFDPTTASASVLLSDDSSSLTVEHSGLLAWKDHQVNLELNFRVLCSQNFTRGQHYWEVMPPRDLRRNWAVGVTYKNCQDCYQGSGQDQRSWYVIWRNAGKKTSDNCEKNENTDTCKGAEDAILKRTLRKTREDNVLHAAEYGGDAPKRTKEKVVKDKVQGHVTATRKKENNKVITGFFASHNQNTHLISKSPPGKIGVHLDCDRGWLSFFTVSGSRVRLCYRFQTLSSKPLRPAVWLRDPEETTAISTRGASDSEEQMGS
ncbi:E3 ubiquitin-protein ligase TRIM11-like isoform X1 [Astyanax mexicanus]|uniref:E3 ubiquitin-protein ligase TRIM11-like isoform X1 n=1 Tax=Astyanax mexicanus TaxID=7994 RepID=UPI0020CB0D2A|nr:E3 ubiquitin-protein ligase TRIM11-like isoform X1 [Astyanax mexicanus]